MNFDRIHPYVRFVTKQVLVNSKDLAGCTEPLVGLDNRLYYCTDGAGYVTVSGIRYDMSPGDMLLWRAGSPYSYAATSGSFTCTTCNFDYFPDFHTIQIPTAPVPQPVFQPRLLLEVPFTFAESHSPFNQTIYLKNAIYLNADFDELVTAYESRFNHYSLRCTILFSQILLKVLQTLESGTNDQQQTLVSDISNYVRIHYAESLSNESIGKKFGYHPVYINSLFKKYTNTSLHQYVINTRLHQAVQLLMETDYSIDEISSAVGFSSAHYFSRLFKEHFKTNPSFFRMNNVSM